MGGRFSKPVLPGDTLTLRAWTDGGSTRFVVENSDDLHKSIIGRSYFSTSTAAAMTSRAIPRGITITPCLSA